MVRWSEHAKQRAREMVAQGLSPNDLARAVESPASSVVSVSHGGINQRYGDVTVGFSAEQPDLIVTVLWSTREAWRRSFETGLVPEGREYRG